MDEAQNEIRIVINEVGVTVTLTESGEQIQRHHFDPASDEGNRKAIANYLRILADEIEAGPDTLEGEAANA